MFLLLCFSVLFKHTCFFYISCFLFLFYCSLFFFFFFFNDTATTEIYTLSLHDALPIWAGRWRSLFSSGPSTPDGHTAGEKRSEEHTSELQSRLHLVCRLLLEKKKKKTHKRTS